MLSRIRAARHDLAVDLQRKTLFHRIIHGAAADTAFHQDYGWIFDPDTGSVWAAAFDDNDAPLPRVP